MSQPVSKYTSDSPADKCTRPAPPGRDYTPYQYTSSAPPRIRNDIFNTQVQYTSYALADRPAPPIRPAEVHKAMEEADCKATTPRKKLSCTGCIQLQSELQQLHQDRDRKVQAAETECSRLQTELQQLHRDKDRKVQVAESECSRLQTELQRLHQDNHVKDRKVQAAESECSRLQTELQQLQQDNEVKERKVQKSQSEYVKLKQDTDDIISKLKSDIDNLRATAFKFVPRVIESRDTLYTWSPLPGCIHSSAVHSPIPPTSPEYQYISDLFVQGRHTPRIFEIVSIDVLGCPDVAASYTLKVKSMIGLRKQGLKCKSFTEDVGNKMASLDRIAPRYLRREEGRVKQMLAWAGVPEKAVPGIACTGMTPLGSTDSGYFGTGVYTTLQAEYACQYALNEFHPTELPLRPGSIGTVLLCWVVVGNVYPVTRSADYEGTNWHSKFFVPGTGSIGVSGDYTAHHATVCKSLKYQVPPDPFDGEYDEIVVAESSQVLPQYLVKFKEI